MNNVYLQRQRHILLDMHIPDWDDAFLTRFDPDLFVELCHRATADAVMVYCNSHVGLCNWPSRSGQMHRGLGGRDIVRTQVDGLHDHGIAACAYYSGPVFNGWAYTEHPDWRIVPSSGGGMAGPGSRYGVVCPNNPACMDFMLEQVDELASGYDFDAFFFDMVFWTSVCVCRYCHTRFSVEEGEPIPAAVDWFSPAWSRFQAARERWLTEAFRRMRDQVKRHRDIPVFLNGGIIKFDWWAGTSLELLRENDLVGGDFHSQSVLPALAQLTPSVMQYMKAVSAYGGGASQLMSVEEQKAHALAATTFGGQFMAIDAVAPDGSVTPAVYERLREVFAAMEPYEDFVGGRPIADIGVYWSQQAAVSFDDNGTSLDALGGRLMDGPPSPHSRAVDGAIEALKAVHLPVGVLTKADLDELDSFTVIVLPNVLRMDSEEVSAFRRYVDRGGRLYASGLTSLVSVDGVRHDEFLLADVFGARFAREETDAVTYLKPATPEAFGWIDPVSYVAHGESDVNQERFGSPLTTLRVSADVGTEVLATTTLPFGTGNGTRDDEQWASIHNSPPWTDTGHPAVIRHRFGRGEVIYSVADIETADRQAATAAPEMFVGIVRALLGRPAIFEADTHPDVWVTGFRDADRLRLCFLNHPARFPALPVPRVEFRVSPAVGNVARVRKVATGEDVAFHRHPNGTISGIVEQLELFEMLEVFLD